MHLVHAFARRNKIQRGTEKLLPAMQKRFDMTIGATMFAALRFGESQGADLRAIVEAESGQAPTRPKRWWQRVDLGGTE